MRDYKECFKGKKITMLGLGLLGRGLNDAKFLAECGADLIVTDLKTADELKPTLKKLQSTKSNLQSTKFVLGEHRLEDFRNRDFILKSAGVPLGSPYIAEAKKNNIPIEMDESLFFKLVSDVTLIGVTGTRGKTTTTYLIYEILKAAYGEKVHLGGNIRGLATLPLLKKIRPGDMVVAELSSWQLQGFGEAKISPQISVFTNLLPDHLNYYLIGSKDEKEAKQKYFLDKAQIFANQKAGDHLILDRDIKKIILQRYSRNILSTQKIIGNRLPAGWKPKIKGEHNVRHILRAMEVAKILGVDLKIIKKAVENFGGVDGRQQLVREYKGIKIYNDTTATTPDATVVALKSLGDKKKKNLVLIIGGSDKGLVMSVLIKEAPKYCKKIIVLDGIGSDKLKIQISKIKAWDYAEASSLKEAVKKAVGYCKRGDTLLLSPAHASKGMFKNEYDRGDQFVKIINDLK
ncbi:MAG: UDP-N-acetylmuramoyl-L-alanine--D-glutamate ligase [bacterium]